MKHCGEIANDKRRFQILTGHNGRLIGFNFGAGPPFDFLQNHLQVVIWKRHKALSGGFSRAEGTGSGGHLVVLGRCDLMQNQSGTNRMLRSFRGPDGGGYKILNFYSNLVALTSGHE